MGLYDGIAEMARLCIEKDCEKCVERSYMGDGACVDDLLWGLANAVEELNSENQALATERDEYLFRLRGLEK